MAAYKLTGDEKYAEHAVKHLLAWFVDPATVMNPNLMYGQAIMGRVTGRGIGIIDTLHLAEVARAVQVLEELGYLAGLGVYKVLGFLNLALEVRQKVSAIWSIAAIGIAMTAVLIGALSALKSSVVITPSLQRKWQIEDERRPPLEPFEMVIPVMLLPENIDPFIEFMIQEIDRLASDPIRKITTIKVFGKTKEADRRIDFVYKTVGSATRFYSKNSLLVEKTPDDKIIVKLRSDGERKWVHTTGSMIRMIAMRWSVL